MPMMTSYPGPFLGPVVPVPGPAIVMAPPVRAVVPPFVEPIFVAEPSVGIPDDIIMIAGVVGITLVLASIL